MNLKSLIRQLFGVKIPRHVLLMENHAHSFRSAILPGPSKKEIDKALYLYAIGECYPTARLTGTHLGQKVTGSFYAIGQKDSDQSLVVFIISDNFGMVGLPVLEVEEVLGKVIDFKKPGSTNG